MPQFVVSQVKRWGVPHLHIVFAWWMLTWRTTEVLWAQRAGVVAAAPVREKGLHDR